MSELNLSKHISISFPEGPEKMLHFEINIQPTEGIYKCAALAASNGLKE